MANAPAKDVLIIEDNYFMAQLLSEKLTNEGVRVVHAQDGVTGLAELEKKKPDLVLLDLPLSGKLDGWKTLEGIREQDEDIQVLVLFSTDEKKDIARAQDLGITSHLVKADVNAATIVEKTMEILVGKPAAPARAKKAAKAEKETKAQKAVETETPPPDFGRTSGFGGLGGADLVSQALALKEQVEQTIKLPEPQISIIKMVDDLMTYAFMVRASDIHLEPFEDRFVARMRIDGVLNDTFVFPKALQSGLITRIKVLAGMRTDEHQAAQDGRFRMLLAELVKQFDVRVSIVPTYYGENGVLRLLAEQTAINSLDDLALTELNRKKIRKAVQTPYGMILATGPTGSGKTTTLYTILKELNTREVSVITIEDPIEYSLDGVDQIQVNARTGLTFANGLRSVLRQDPNIIMVGEIRDEETASIAVNAALTGHKLLSTLHTNDAATTLPRLLDMGVEPFLVASTVNIAIGQRLLRMICEDCKVPRRISEAEFTALKEHVPAEVLDNHHDFFIGKGCKVCHDTGYRGRMGIYEILEMNDFIREAVMRRADAGEVKKIAVKNGMMTLLEDGFKKAVGGLTTIEEILRVIHE